MAYGGSAGRSVGSVGRGGGAFVRSGSGGVRHSGGHRHHRRGGVYFAEPYAYDYGYSYGYGECGWLRQRAIETGRRYWWRRYWDCRDG